MAYFDFHYRHAEDSNVSKMLQNIKKKIICDKDVKYYIFTTLLGYKEGWTGLYTYGKT